MSNPEQNPEIDHSVHEKMSLYALILNIHETMGTARRLNNEHIASMRANGRSLAHRYVMTEKPLPSVSGHAQVLPVTAERVVLRPEESTEHNVALLIVRVPIHEEEDGTPKDTFIELVDIARQRWQFLLNGEGLWPYENVTDLDTKDGNHFRVRGEAQPENSVIMEQMSRLIARAGLGQQTSFDLDIE